jgi:hypothetical protein
LASHAEFIDEHNIRSDGIIESANPCLNRAANQLLEGDWQAAGKRSVVLMQGAQLLSIQVRRDMCLRRSIVEQPCHL